MCHANLKNLGAAIEAYSEDHGRYPAELSLLSPNYLKTLPTCQSAWDQAYTYEVQFDQPFKSFRCPRHRAWESEECRRKLSHLSEIQSASPVDIGSKEQFTELTCPSGDPYLFVTHHDVFQVYCAGKNHPEVPRDCPRFDRVNGLIDFRSHP